MRMPSTRTLNFVSGLGLVGLGVLDAALNPFAFATAPHFFTAGVGLMVASQSSEKKPASRSKRRKDEK
ncbi:hypothetical protein [Brevundimonas sp.]|uniref:hypothetical protein n=1 Tax=Brevundimonas sp. TaxID=1871086 RepID=UPI002E161D16|nr:hypothetical protein [Brevundimonas sp.]